MVVEPLTLKSGMVVPRSPVNNCGKLTDGGDPVMSPTPSEQAAAVLNLILMAGNAEITERDVFYKGYLTPPVQSTTTLLPQSVPFVPPASS